MKATPYTDDADTFKEEFSRNDDGSLPPKVDDTPAVTQKAEMAKDTAAFKEEFDRGDEPPVKAEVAAVAAPAKTKSFKEAFAENRKAGAKEFEWNGKKYNTAVAGEKPAAKKVSPAAAKNMGKDVTVLPDAPAVVVTAKREGPAPEAPVAPRKGNEGISHAQRDAEAKAAQSNDGIHKAVRAVGKFFEQVPREQLAQADQTRK